MEDVKLTPDLEARVRLGERVRCPGCDYPVTVWNATDPPIASCFNVGCRVHHNTIAELGYQKLRGRRHRDRL